MRVLLTLPRMNSGGVETHIDYLARSLMQNGWEVILVCKEGRLVQDLERAGAVFRRLDVASQSPFTLPSRIKAMEKIIQEEKVDLVHAHSRVPAWIGYYASRRAGIPFITTAHSQYSLHLGTRVMVWGDRVIAVSETVARHLKQGWDLSLERFRIIPEGIDVDRFLLPSEVREEVRKELGIDPGALVIGTVARMTTIKGHRYLLEAFGFLEKDCVLLLVGEGRKQQELKKLSQDLKIEDRVVFAGDRQDVPRVLQAMDIYVQSSLAEGLGLAALEAMAAGLPVILTRCGGLAEEVKEEKEALLIPPGEARPMKEAMEKLAEKKDLRIRLGKAGRAMVRAKYSPGAMVGKTIEVYREVLEKGEAFIR